MSGDWQGCQAEGSEDLRVEHGRFGQAAERVGFDDQETVGLLVPEPVDAGVAADAEGLGDAADLVAQAIDGRVVGEGAQLDVRAGALLELLFERELACGRDGDRRHRRTQLAVVAFEHGDGQLDEALLVEPGP